MGLRTNLKIWEPGPAWDKFFQGEGKATNGFTLPGDTTRRLTRMLFSIPCTIQNQAAGSAGGIHVYQADDLIDTGRSTLDKEKRLAAYTKVQSLIKDEAPSIFVFAT